MDLTLSRMQQLPLAIRGVLAIDGDLFCFTLEHFQHAITPGVYQMVRRSWPSTSFGMQLYEIMDVPGRSDILWHPGNIHSDTLGCILPGMEIGMLGAVPAVLRSADAIKALHKRLSDKESILTIKEEYCASQEEERYYP